MNCDSLHGMERELQQKRDAWRQIAAGCPAIPCETILAECARKASLEPLVSALRELDVKIAALRDQRGLLIGEVRFVGRTFERLDFSSGWICLNSYTALSTNVNIHLIRLFCTFRLMSTRTTLRRFGGSSRERVSAVRVVRCAHAASRRKRRAKTWWTRCSSVWKRLRTNCVKWKLSSRLSRSSSSDCWRANL